jgi:hypothetical protein
MGKDPRQCERQCRTCKQWKHHSRFHLKTKPGNTTLARWDADCRDCQQKKRNEIKNLDRPKSIIEQRAQRVASKAGVSRDFVMTTLNYQALIPVLRAMMTPEGRCLSCGHGFLDEGDSQIEHLEPPRHKQDWARLHARNLRIECCGSCNRTKGSKSFAEWLDDQEGARLSNLEVPYPRDPVLSVPALPLFPGF